MIFNNYDVCHEFIKYFAYKCIIAIYK